MLPSLWRSLGSPCTKRATRTRPALLERHADIRAVFTDIHMPGSMDGLKLAHYVRGRWPPVKLIMTSGHARPPAEDMPTGSGFVGKPYQLEKVAHDLRAIVG